MADVIGPSSYLPGQTLAVPPGTCCDVHPDRAAVKRVVGETDSFGSELIDLCDSCAATLLEGIRRERAKPHVCDWCKQEKEGCRPRRDFEEGQGGPVYMVCPDCIRMESARLASDYGDYDD
jgi:hypothetical protein